MPGTAIGIIVVDKLSKETPVESPKSAAPVVQESAAPSRPAPSAKKESFQQRYARDLREQLIAKAEQGNIRDAATSLLGLVEEDIKAFEDERVQISAATLAKRMGSSDETTQKVFYALAHKTGSAGLDVLYRVYDETPAGSPPWQRSESILALAAAGKRMSKELRIAWELRRSSCDQKHLLFERAGNDGDDRTLRLLTELGAPGCDKSAGQCCYGRDLKLKKARAHIEDRQKPAEP